MPQPGAAADDEGAPEQRLDLLGRGVGGDVEVLGPQADDQVAHRAAHDVGLVAGLLQRAHDAHRVGVEQRRVDAVGLGRHLDALAERDRRRVGGRVGRGGCRRLAQQPVDELPDHVKSLMTGQPPRRAGRAGSPARRRPRRPRGLPAPCPAAGR